MFALWHKAAQCTYLNCKVCNIIIIGGRIRLSKHKYSVEFTKKTICCHFYKYRKYFDVKVTAIT